jgi:hypothetical protein
LGLGSAGVYYEIRQVVRQSVREQRMKLMNLFFAMAVAMIITGTQRMLVKGQ